MRAALPPAGRALTRALCLASVSLAGAASGAPLDALLTATPTRTDTRATIEVGADRLNRRLDFLTPSADDPTQDVSTRGHYDSAHVLASVRVVDGLWLSGGLWRRNLGDEVDNFRYRSWQASAQYRFNEGGGSTPALAVRLTGWGNRASVTETTTPVRVPGAVLDSVTVAQPADRQVQADLIGTWQLGPALEVSALIGGGTTRLSFDKLTATTRRNGCKYNLSFNGNDIFGTLAEPCNVGGGVIQQFFDSSGDYGVDVANEIAWHGSFMHAGVNAGWRSGPWQLRGGVLFHRVRRQVIDDILATRGDASHRRNKVIELEADYAVNRQLGVFARAELASNLFMHDLPVTYNTVTSKRFASSFSVFTLGLRAAF